MYTIHVFIRNLAGIHRELILLPAPHNFLPRWFVNTFQKMRNEDGEELKTTEKTEYLFNRELAESGIDNDNLADIMVRFSVWPYC